MTKADVFCLVDSQGKPLAPAVQATVLAKYSRSPESARTIVASLSAEEADKFQDKWVVSYGHNSVAELAALPVCLEGISIVASKFIESWQRPGYSEKSTRYQVFSRDSFVTPPGAPATMKNFASRFYDAYENLMEPMIKICAEKMGKDPNDPEVLKNRLVKARAFDNLRYLLPAGTGTNVAVHAYVRDFRDMIVHLRGHSNPEFKVLGDQIHDALQEVVPTLVRHTEPDTFALPLKSVGGRFAKQKEGVSEPSVSLVNSTSQASYESQVIDFKNLVSDRHGMSWTSFCKHMETRRDWQQVPDVFKSIRLSFGLMMDYGAYRDLQRHRRCEQYAEPLSSDYGFLVPDDIKGSHVEQAYIDAMSCIESYDDEEVVYNMDLMQYMVPLGYLHRSVFEMDLRELYYIVELRTKPQGHISYRRIAYEMFEAARNIYPELLRWCKAIRPDAIGEHALSGNGGSVRRPTLPASTRARGTERRPQRPSEFG